VVGSDGIFSSTEDGGVLLSEREAVYTGGRSVISGVADGSRKSTGSKLRGYVGGGVEELMKGAASFGGEDGGVEESQGCSRVPEIAWSIGCAAVVISDGGGSWISVLELTGIVCPLYASLICLRSVLARRTTN